MQLTYYSYICMNEYIYFYLVLISKMINANR